MAIAWESTGYGSSPLWYAAGALVLVFLFMAVIGIVGRKELMIGPDRGSNCQAPGCSHATPTATPPRKE